MPQLFLPYLFIFLIFFIVTSFTLYLSKKMGCFERYLNIINNLIVILTVGLIICLAIFLLFYYYLFFILDYLFFILDYYTFICEEHVPFYIVNFSKYDYAVKLIGASIGGVAVLIAAMKAAATFMKQQLNPQHCNKIKSQTAILYVIY